MGPWVTRVRRSDSVFVRRMMATWADMDFNGHMKNTAFLDKAADARLLYFAGCGFPTEEFARRRLGPIVVRDDIEYRKEVSLLEEIDVTLALAGLSPDGARWMLRTEVLRPGGRACARLTATGGWLDLDARRLVAPPPELLAALEALARTADFETLRSVVRGGAREPREPAAGPMG